MQNPIVIISLELGAAIFYWLVIVSVESAALQLVAWGNFQQCIKASLLTNLASVWIVSGSLILIPRNGLTGVVVGGIATFFIEGLVLKRLDRSDQQLHRRNWRAAGLANLISYSLLIFPIYLLA